MTTPEYVALSALARELKALTGQQSPSYVQLWKMVVDGRLPVETINGRHYVPRPNLPTVAKLVGLTVPTDRVAA